MRAKVEEAKKAQSSFKPIDTSKLEEEVAALQKQIPETTAKQIEATSSTSSLESQLDTLNNEVSGLKQANFEANKITEEMTRNTPDLAALQKNIKSMQSRYAELLRDIATLEKMAQAQCKPGELDKMYNTIGEMQEKVKTLRQENANLKGLRIIRCTLLN